MPETYTLETIQLKALVTDAYQRGLVKVRAERIAGRFDVAKAGVIIVSTRNKGEGWFIIDGQHRCHAALEAKVPELPAILWSGLSPEREAELFYAFNNDRWSVNPVDLFKTRVFAKDPIASEINSILAKMEVRVGYSQGSKANISATVATEVLHAWGVLEQTIALIQTAKWNEQKRGMNSSTLLGLGSILVVYPEIAKTRLTNVMEQGGLTRFLQAAEGMNAVMPGPLWEHLARALIAEYNLGLGVKGRLENYRAPLRPRGGKFNLVNPNAG